MLDLDRIRTAHLRTDPYPYTVVENAISVECMHEALKDFPSVDMPGSVPLSAVEPGPAFTSLIEEMNSETFRQLVADKFSVDLDGKPIMTTLRGVMREKDGRIHTDSKTKIITVLVYFNDQWQDQGGYLRILRNGTDLESYVEEVPPKLGTMVIFQVTDNCWHGHKPLVGKRLSIQMNYLTGEAAMGKHQFFHKLSAKVKKLFSGKS